MTSVCLPNHYFDLSDSWYFQNNDSKDQLPQTECSDRYMTWGAQGKPLNCAYDESPLQTGPTAAAVSAHAPESPPVLHRKQDMHLNWQCFMVNTASVAQVTILNSMKLNTEGKLTVQGHKTWRDSLSIFRNWGKLFKQEPIHMENHLPRICLLLHSDPRHQEVNNILYKHWVRTQNHITTLNSQRTF